MESIGSLFGKPIQYKNGWFSFKYGKKLQLNDFFIKAFDDHLKEIEEAGVEIGITSQFTGVDRGIRSVFSVHNQGYLFMVCPTIDAAKLFACKLFLVDDGCELGEKFVSLTMELNSIHCTKEYILIGNSDMNGFVVGKYPLGSAAFAEFNAGLVIGIHEIGEDE
jgi:hypothetical protein